jgi:hypothetical protein
MTTPTARPTVILTAIMCVAVLGTTILGACADPAAQPAVPHSQITLPVIPSTVGVVAPSCDRVGARFLAGTSLTDREGWYGRQLRAAGERPLCQSPEQPHVVYRLTWIPSFHPSVIVLIERTSVGYQLRAKTLSGAGGYDPGHLARDTMSSLTDTDLETFARLLAAARFWQLPTTPLPNGMMGLDGAQWMLEGLSDGRYHIVDRWSPNSEGPDAAFRQLANWLLARSGLVNASIVREY